MLPLIAAMSMRAFARDCDTSEDVLLVGVEKSAPFAMYDPESKSWSGLSVELWEKIAQDNNWQFRYVESEFHQILNDVSNCELDVGLPGITITADREAVMDFSHPYLIEDVAVATSAFKDYWTVSCSVFMHLLQPMTLLFMVLVTIGWLYAILEKRSGSSWKDFFDSVYWAMTTLVTVGYGDEAPKNTIGRIFAMGWMFSALFILASINAQVMGAFQAISWKPEINQLSDLEGKKVLTVKDSYSDHMLNMAHVQHEVADTEAEMFLAFENREFEYLVYDRSILSFHLTTGSILDTNFHEQYLGFALRNNFPQKEELNRSLLLHTDSRWWSMTVFTYHNRQE